MKNHKNPISVMHIIPTLEIGGAERQLVFLANEQINNGYDVNIAVRKKGFLYKKLNDKVKVHIIGDYKFIDPRLLLNLLKLIKLCKPNIINTWLPQMNVIGGIASLITKKIWVSTERTGDRFYHDKFNLINFFQEIILHYSAILVVNSKNGFLYWVRKISKKKIVIVENAINFKQIKDFQKKKFRTKKIEFISVGRFVTSKNFNNIIKAIKLIPSLSKMKFKIIGYGSQKNEIKNLIKKLNLKKRVNIIDNSKNWFKNLSYSTGLISMSRFEGQPNVLLEAAAANCPLIISDIPEHKDIFDKKSAMFVPLDNYKKLSEAIQFLASNPVYARKIAKAARNKIKERTIKNQFMSYDKIYKKLLKTFKKF